MVFISWMQSHALKHNHNLNLCTPVTASELDVLVIAWCDSEITCAANFCLFFALIAVHGSRSNIKVSTLAHSLIFNLGLRLHRQCDPVRSLLFRCLHTVASAQWLLRWGLCSTDEAGKQRNVLGKELLFQRRFASWAPCCLCFLSTLHCYKAKRNTTRLNWQGEVRESTVQFSFMAALYILTCPCAVVVKGLAADLAVMFCARGVLEAPDTCCSVCALAIGTSTHSDRHLPSSSNPFYSSSPDDKSYFPYRHSEKELGEKQLKTRWWVEHLSPSHFFPHPQCTVYKW